ncbi:hypothetical protein SAMN04488056_108141 [Cohaesibacter marisflavi]|uniref:Cell pole-organizing protein PopZ n=2 Tax=Cohaesibacter marisflavi TaxID=655353 RepID=A0A1I5IAY3_9HYPH|nr:hypothetical protein SAMN04488056_108141 [Cohaesibacter marisflavi]
MFTAEHARSMTCLSLVSGEAMSNSSAAQEPSMEEILASIRRIISDEEAAIGDEATPAKEPEADPDEAMSQEALDALFDEPSPQPEPEEEEIDMAAAMAAMEEEEAPKEEDVLELSSEWQESDFVEPQDDDVMFANAEQATKEQEETAPIEDIVNQKLEEAVPEALQSAFSSASMPDGPLPNVERGAPLVSDDTSQKVTSAFGDLTHTILNNNSRTIENVVEDMLRPMLKAWLDQNLPVMVERLVRAEIERVSRGEQHYR